MKLGKLFICFMFIFLIANVYALGVTPARNTVNFEAGLEENYAFRVVNSEAQDMNIAIGVKGELKDSIVLEEKEFLLSSSEESKTIKYRLNLPNKLEPGLHTAEIVILQLPEDFNEDNLAESALSIVTQLAVVTQVYVYVPYPGKYAEMDLNILSDGENDEVVFVIPILSRGEFDLGSVRANIDIYDSFEKKIDSINTESISIPSMQKKDIVYKWKPTSGSGVFDAKVTVIYDGESKTLQKSFTVGSGALELQDISVNNFQLGEIAKMEMLVENKIAENLTNVFAETKIYNPKKELVSSFNSPSYNILAGEKNVLVSYWDTVGVLEGLYDVIVSLNYGESSIDSDLQLDVKKNEVRVIGLGYVISSGGDVSSSGMSSLVFVLIILIVVLILINILWFFFLRKKIKR